MTILITTTTSVSDTNCRVDKALAKHMVVCLEDRNNGQERFVYVDNKMVGGTIRT
jgi:hypothetical protein